MSIHLSSWIQKGYALVYGLLRFHKNFDSSINIDEKSQLGKHYCLVIKIYRQLCHSTVLKATEINWKIISWTMKLLVLFFNKNFLNFWIKSGRSFSHIVLWSSLRVEHRNKPRRNVQLRCVEKCSEMHRQLSKFVACLGKIREGRHSTWKGSNSHLSNHCVFLFWKRTMQ